MKDETSMGIVFGPLAVDNTSLGAFFTSYCDGFAFEVDIPVTVADIGSRSYKNGIAITAVVNRFLDENVRIGPACAVVGSGGVVVDVDGFCCGGRAQC
jgi:hypothetical protein